MFKWLQTLALSHYSVLDPKYMRGSYNGIGKAKYLLEILNNTQKDKNQVIFLFNLKKNFLSCKSLYVSMKYEEESENEED